MKMPPCPATNGSWQMLEVLGDGGSGEGPSFKKGLPPKMHSHEKRSENNVPRKIRAGPTVRELVQYLG